jgi:hypothetical protein
MIYDPLSAFRLIDGRLATESRAQRRAMLIALRERLAGEMLGEVERVVSAVDDGFVLRTCLPSGAVEVTALDAFREGLARMQPIADQMLMWVELDHLLIEDNSMAGEGVLRTLVTSHLAREMYNASGVDDDCLYLSKLSLAFFIDFTGSKMAAETVYMDPSSASVEPLKGESFPDKALIADDIGVPAGSGR